MPVKVTWSLAKRKAIFANKQKSRNIILYMVKIGNLSLGNFPLLLAPMEDVTDPPFRALCKMKGADLMYTEFISAESLIRSATKSVQKLDIYDYEQPIGIQIFGNELKSMQQAAAMAEIAGPALIDINYGCPVRKIACKGAGAGILLDLPKMQALTAAIVKQVSIPVTVKTRLGWDRNSIKILEVAQRLQDAGIQALTIHGRTREQMYRGEADWEPIAAVKNHPSIHIPIFGNGDIDSAAKAIAYRKKYGVDGIMIGRASIGYPWIFQETKHLMQVGEELPPPDLSERLTLLRIHLRHAIDWKGEKPALLEMRRHYTHYLRGIENIKTYRMELVQALHLEEIEETLQRLETNYNSI